MENKKALVFFSTLILSCFIEHSDAFLGFKKYKLMNKYSGKSLFNASKLVINAEKIVYSQKGLKENDKIKILPGQPKVTFNQYGGYVTVDKNADRALFYYFVEAQDSAQTSPLVLWLNGGPGCSSLAYGAMQELGPFRVMSDGKTLFLNKYAWNKAANILFLESPAGVGFSYSNNMADNMNGGDNKTANDNYVFLMNWLKRFPEYKNRDFYIAGESYAGYYVPELAHIILINQNNNNNKLTVKFKGIIIGNAAINDDTDNIGMYKYWASHALITDDLAKQVIKDCVIDSTFNLDKCKKDSHELDKELGNIDIYNIYAPICLSTKLTDTTPKPTSIYNPDPCSDIYVHAYMNRAEVQKALHANVTNIPYDWESCSPVLQNWEYGRDTVLPLLKDFMKHGLRVWVYSGDVDGMVPVTSTQLSINEMKLHIEHQWRPWYFNNEVGGYTQEYYGGLTFVTVRGAGHEVPKYQPERALVLIQQFLKGESLPVP